MNYETLLEAAKDGMKNAYVPYSNFKVGAAVLTKEGKIYKGCNIENSSYGATNCAERTAIFKAVSEGETEFTAIAIVSSSPDFTFPCGICRQVMGEFMLDGELVLCNQEGEIKTFTIRDILPFAFTKDELNYEGKSDEIK